MKDATAEDSTLPRDAKIISAILRSLGIEECEPKVIIQLLEFAYKYSVGVVEDANDFAIHCERSNITIKDIKIAIQTKASQKFLPAPSKTLLQATVDRVNKRPLTVPDTENLIRAPNMKSGLYGLEHDIDE